MSLPNEILASIFRHVHNTAPRYSLSLDKNTPALHAIIRVSRKWHLLGIPILYSVIKLVNINKAIAFVEVLFHFNPAYAAFTVHLDFSRVILPDILVSRLTRCTFPKISIIKLNPEFSRHLYQTNMVPARQLRKLDFGGIANQKVIDRHGETLRVLTLAYRVQSNAQKKALISLSLPHLWKLDLTYRQGNKQAVSGLLRHVPSLTHLTLRIRRDGEMLDDAVDAFEQGLHCLLDCIGPQLRKLHLRITGEGESWAIENFRFNKFDNLETFEYAAVQFPDFPDMFQSLPQSLQELRLICEEPQLREVQDLLNFLAIPDRFPNLKAIPDMRIGRLCPQDFDAVAIEQSRRAAYSAFVSRALEDTQQPYYNGFWSIWQLRWEDVRDKYEEDEDSD